MMTKRAPWLQKLIDKDPLGYETAVLILDSTEAVRLAMEDEGVNMTELALRVGKPLSVVSRQLGEGSNMTVKTLAKYAHALDRRVVIRLDGK